MSSFMQKIVHEVLARNNPPQHEKREEKAPSAAPSPSSIPNLYRPNYQRQKQKERVQLNGSPHQTSVDLPSSHHPLSSLQTLTTAQFIQGSKPTKGGDGKDGARLIGKTRNGQQVWYFPRVHPSWNDLPIGCTVGFISGAWNTGTLFIVDECIQQSNELKAELCREASAIQLRLSQSNELEEVLKGLFHRINRRSIRPIDCYFSEHPSPFLLDSLTISGSNSVAALVGVDYISAMALLDRYFHRNPDVSFRFHVVDNSLLLVGDSVIVRNAIKQIHDDADQLLG